MSQCMNFYLNWHRNCTWSKLKVCFLLSKYQSSSYEHVQLLCQLRQKFIHQLILKLLSIVKSDAKGQRMLAFLRSKTALCKWPIQYIKPVLSKQKFSLLYDPNLGQIRPKSTVQAIDDFNLSNKYIWITTNQFCSHSGLRRIQIKLLHQ